MKQITVECKNIAKQFISGETRTSVLRDVSCVMYAGEMVMLMGPSGSGKTTFISVIAGIVRQDAGTCLVLGRDINFLPESEKTPFRGEHIGFMFQNFNLVPTLTCVENVAIPLLLQGVTRKQALLQAEELLFNFGLDEQRYRNPKSLSGGEQQRVAIARACIHKPGLIVCDEPTSFLDKERGRWVLELLQTIKNAYQCTVIVVTHDPRILDFADRILYMEDGHLKSSNDGS